MSIRKSSTRTVKNFDHNRVYPHPVTSARRRHERPGLRGLVEPAQVGPHVRGVRVAELVEELCRPVPGRARRPGVAGGESGLAEPAQRLGLVVDIAQRLEQLAGLAVRIGSGPVTVQMLVGVPDAVESVRRPALIADLPEEFQRPSAVVDGLRVLAEPVATAGRSGRYQSTETNSSQNGVAYALPTRQRDSGRSLSAATSTSPRTGRSVPTSTARPCWPRAPGSIPSPASPPSRRPTAYRLDECADEVTASREPLDDDRFYLAGSNGWIVLIQAAGGYEVPGLTGWASDGSWHVTPADAVAILRHWHDRYGAELVAMWPGVQELAVSRPPVDPAAAMAVAREQYAYCPDVISQGAGSLADLMAIQVRARRWFFWWD